MKIYLSVALLAFATFVHAQTCETGDCHINPMPLYNQYNAAFPNYGRNFCAPAVTAMMIQSQLDKPGVTVPVGSWTYNNFPPLYTTQVLAEAVETHTDPYSGTAGFNIHLGFVHPLQDVENSDGTLSVYEESNNYPAQRSLNTYKAKLRSGYAIGLLIDRVCEKRVYDGFPSCNLLRYEYRKNGSHFVAVYGYDGNFLFINNPMGAHQARKEFGVMPHTKNGVPVQVYLESGYLVPSWMNVSYLGPTTTYVLPATCPPNNADCQCDQALGITRAPVYASIPMFFSYLAH